ncbi:MULTISPECIES: porphobilinogen synthase [Thermoactinomyces]|uniref:Delta-aminolevulinic acid dehydratase n=1 Tax=Thermoactinomyces daqus TaxID=1329516 RepID=A0A7W2AH32_9BACL|nr:MULTISPECIES: porphobilinogen synthase [Thermoactinomyces]MBA4541408.1 porphobilinogen synthase [Thermoactinomyces daqus]MBH8596880.1 porphobilinogen synthase [Thermoactinomyces sp. CICC 10523]MBH8603640.1 porphobilinogen synthase [Thermoactinomyces sp. CICC 10522]MBH8606805.1 porphobilinogen synthase [Thermoactinomyces sp. CICC 10521]
MQSYIRHRRLRASEQIRRMVREHHVHVEDLIYPIFVVEGENIKQEVPSMPEVYHYSLDRLHEEMDELVRLGISSVIIFGVPAEKDERGSSADDEQGIVQKAIRYIKEKYPSIYVIADTCLCQYTSHGHCGIVENGVIVNDASLTRLVSTAVSQARAGADMIAPSNMMDGFVYEIRKGLDEAGFSHIPIMSYAVKYASSFYGPFRDAAHSTPQFGDRRTYQMDPANVREAMREAASDVAEGADMLIVKPGLPYLDVMVRVRERFDLPVVAYNVSGEYSMVKAAALNGWIDEKQVVTESMLAFKRAGADLIITYHAKDLARWLKGGE